jgi:large subunit ribosomal protein L28
MRSKSMARVCALTGKKVQYGHNVSHSKRATNRRFEPNIQKVRLQSESLGQRISLSIAARTLRTVQKKGGLDGFLLGTEDRKLQPGALRLKNKIRKKLSGR